MIPGNPIYDAIMAQIGGQPVGQPQPPQEDPNSPAAVLVNSLQKKPAPKPGPVSPGNALDNRGAAMRLLRQGLAR